VTPDGAPEASRDDERLMLGDVDNLSSTAGYVAIAAAAVAVVALGTSLGLAVALRRIRAAQRAVLGTGQRDLVAHATELESSFRALESYVIDAANRLEARVTQTERRLDGAVAYRALVRYDAYGEMSGRQSTSIALLDANQSGVVLSSIHHREHARLYAKQVTNGKPELELSPEEQEAVRRALAGDAAPADSGIELH
jgi:hypothetical protein